MEVGLIAPGELLHPEAVDFAHRLVELCACIAEQYDSAERNGNASERIRAELAAMTMTPTREELEYAVIDPRAHFGQVDDQYEPIHPTATAH